MSLPLLSKKTLATLDPSSNLVLPAPSSFELPERVLQFGEGNFLRAFVDWMLGRLNAQGLFNGRAVLVQPIANGASQLINDQDGLYTVLLRGKKDGEVVDTREVVSSVSRCLDPYREFDAYLACAENPDLRFIVSNTTEAGIKRSSEDLVDARPAPSFPGKLTQLLLARFRYFKGDKARGLVMLPCELIERNGDNLKRTVLETAAAWQLGPDFTRWVNESCLFTNTLVDRIVTGYPKDEAAAIGAELGYEDKLLVAGEIFHCWVIEAPARLEQELPLARAGLDVIWTDDMSPYRERKVRILNGAHTMTVLGAYLAGKETVRECLDDATIRSYMQRGLNEEILPTLALPKADVQAFAAAVTERFENPFIKHYLLSIALNSVSKYKARILGSVLDYARVRNEVPNRLSFALAALIAFYRGTEVRDGALIGQRGGLEYRIQDDAAALEFFRSEWAQLGDGALAKEASLALSQRVLARKDFWGKDLNAELPTFAAAVAEHLHRITNEGASAALQRVA